MRWDDVVEFMGKAAPVVGTLLGGPAGNAVGGLIASALGVDDDPDQVIEALKNDPQAIIKVKELEQLHQRGLTELAIKAEAQRIAANTAQLAQINETMRAELVSGNAFKSSWRPLFGYATALAWVAQVGGTVYVAIFEPTNAPQIINAIASTAPMWAVALAVLGVTVSQRSQDKKTLSGQAEVGLVGAIAERIKGK